MADQGRWLGLVCSECKIAIDYRRRRSGLCRLCFRQLGILKRGAMPATKSLIRSGAVRPRPTNCEECESTRFPLHLHHLDYLRPDKIMWLCPRCHTRWHEEHGGVYGRARKMVEAVVGSH